MPIGVCTDVILKVGNFPISGDWASGMTVDIRWSLCIHSEPSLMEDIGNKVSFAAFAAHLWKLAGLHCWLHGQCGIHCSLGRTGAWVANQAMNKGEWVYHTNRARASRVMEVSKGVEGYKEKGEPIGTTPDRLAVTAVDCVSSWNSFCLTFLSTLDILFDDAWWCHFLLMPFALTALPVACCLSGRLFSLTFLSLNFLFWWCHVLSIRFALVISSESWQPLLLTALEPETWHTFLSWQTSFPTLLAFLSLHFPIIFISLFFSRP